MTRVQLVLLATFSGILLSLPWLNIMPGWILLIAFFPLLIVEDYFFTNKNSSKSIVFFGYAYGGFWLWNALTTWWVMHATLFGGILIIFLNATFMASVWLLFHRMKRRFGVQMGNIALVVFWISFEYLHFNWEIEWPWLTLGNGFANQIKLIQWYEYTGVLGGTLWVLIVNLLIFQIYKTMLAKDKRRAIGTSSLLLILISVPIIISSHQFSSYRENGQSYNLVLLQPNIDPYNEKFADMPSKEQVQVLLQLSDSLVTDSTDYIIGPETALEPIWENPQLIKQVPVLPFHKRALVHKKLKFVLGATTQILFDELDNLPETARKLNDHSYFDVYNSALQIDKSSKIQFYHKSILVSGVEKMPYGRYFSFIEDFIIDLGGTTGSLGSQNEPSNFESEEGLKVAPVICYESVFGQYLTKYVQKGAGLIFIITNDGWWKDTPGYKQHLSFSRLRAIETRRSIARSANTGISAFINQRGEILQQTDWWVRTALSGQLKANKKLTFYVRYGDYIARISAFIAVLLLLYFFAQERIRK